MLRTHPTMHRTVPRALKNGNSAEVEAFGGKKAAGMPLISQNDRADLEKRCPRTDEQRAIQRVMSNHGIILCIEVAFVLLRHGGFDDYQMKPKVHGYPFETSGQPANPAKPMRDPVSYSVAVFPPEREPILSFFTQIGSFFQPSVFFNSFFDSGSPQNRAESTVSRSSLPHAGTPVYTANNPLVH